MAGLKFRSAGAILAMVLAAATLVPPPMAFVVATATAVVAAASDAEARSSSSRSGSSGGYSRSGSSSSRTPSVGSSRSGSSSSSGGYSRSTGGSSSGASRPAPSASDRAISRQNSGEALQRYRTPPVVTAPASRPPAAPDTSATWSRPRVEDYEASQRRRQSWTLPPYAYQTQRSFGAWDAAFLWLMLNSLSNPAHAQFFTAHRDDPGVQAWRREADQVAQSNPAVRDQLQALDGHLASTAGTGGDPAYIPTDIDPVDARATPASGGQGMLWAVLIVLLIVFVLLWLRRRGVAQRRSSGDSAMSLGTNMLRDKLSGTAYKPALFRVGMVVTLDPTPFILAASSTKVALPASLSGGGAISVERVGQVTDGQTTLHRLYLPGDGGMIQLHLDAAGQPDECRYFVLLDEINPADDGEWGLWLDPGEGMIGWPAFDTRDGTTYARAWSPGPSWIEPRRFTERIEDLQGATTRQQLAMLYARQTGAAAPSPTTEYVLVNTVEMPGQAWVEVHVGIDINPTALSLA